MGADVTVFDKLVCRSKRTWRREGLTSFSFGWNFSPVRAHLSGSVGLGLGEDGGARRFGEHPCLKVMREFPKIRGTLFWGPCNNDPAI